MLRLEEINKILAETKNTQQKAILLHEALDLCTSLGLKNEWRKYKSMLENIQRSGIEQARARVEQARIAREKAEKEKQARLQAAKEARAAKMKELGLTWTVRNERG